YAVGVGWIIFLFYVFLGVASFWPQLGVHADPDRIRAERAAAVVAHFTDCGAELAVDELAGARVVQLQLLR
ncbi:hypothetical protein, partial [Burkholderia cenocepacia]|uniref:hypothetical protein n=1 Tax=Burkholderia cenocepacia TaxID=95486 RepID=UPI0024B7E38D